MLRLFPRLQVATACFSSSPPYLNYLFPSFIFMYIHNNHCNLVTAELQLINYYYYYYKHLHAHRLGHRNLCLGTLVTDKRKTSCPRRDTKMFFFALNGKLIWIFWQLRLRLKGSLFTSRTHAQKSVCHPFPKTIG